MARRARAGGLVALVVAVASSDCGRVLPDTADGSDDGGDASVCASPRRDEQAVRLDWDPGAALLAVAGYEHSGNATALWSTTSGGLWATQRMADGTWSAAQNVSPTGSVGAAALAVGLDRSAIAVWERDEGTNFAAPRLYASRYTPESGWSAEVSLDSPATDAGAPVITMSTSAQIAMDLHGDAFVVWDESDGYGGEAVPPVQHIKARRYAPESGWSDTVAIYADPPPNVAIVLHNPSVAVDDAGNALAIWSVMEIMGGVGTATVKIQASRYDAIGASWSAPAYLDQCTPPSCAVLTQDPIDMESSPRVAFDSLGNALAIWQQRGAPGDGIRPWAARFSGGSWGPPEALDANLGITANTVRPGLAIDASGNALAAWQIVGGTNAIYANRYSEGAWHGALPLDSGPEGRSPVVALDDAGNGFVVWDDQRVVWGAQFSASTQAFSTASLLFGCLCDGSFEQAHDARLAFTHGACPSALLVWNGADSVGGPAVYSLAYH